MRVELESLFQQQRVCSRIAIIGLSKNAGKTTFLNWVLKAAPTSRIGVFTTGRDGENKDTVTGLKKPAVFLPADCLFTTTSLVVSERSSYIRLVEKLPYKAGKQQLWLALTLFPTQVEIVGPPTVTAQIAITKRMESHGATYIFIDGSLDRKAVVQYEHIDHVVIVAGTAVGSLSKLKEELQRLIEWMQIPTSDYYPNNNATIGYIVENEWYETEYVSLLGYESTITQLITNKKATAVYLPGVLTDNSWAKSAFLQTGVKLYIRHPFQLQWKANRTHQLLSENRLFCLQQVPIRLVAINSYSPDGHHIDSDQLRTEIRQLITTLPVIDVKELITRP